MSCFTHLSSNTATALVEECLYKLTGIKVPQVFHLLPYTDIAYRDLKLVGNPYNHAALGRAVKLGNCKTGYADNFIKEEAFLNEDISVAQISEELNIHQHHLSITINIEFEQIFYNYVNHHRIKYAEGLLKDPEKKEESILMVACLSGLQSKSSFNKAFKSLNDMTPSEYRKDHSRKTDEALDEI